MFIPFLNLFLWFTEINSNTFHQLHEPVSSDDEFDYVPVSDIECSSSDESGNETDSFIWSESDDGEEHSDSEGSPDNAEFESTIK